MRLALVAALVSPFVGSSVACDSLDCICTDELRFWHVTAVDAAGLPVSDLVLTVVVPRSNDTLDAQSLAALSAPAAGRYAVFSDEFKDRIEPGGELVRAEGRRDGQGFTADFTFAVLDPCRCHATKLAGPASVVVS